MVGECRKEAYCIKSTSIGIHIRICFPRLIVASSSFSAYWSLFLDSQLKVIFKGKESKADNSQMCSRTQLFGQVLKPLYSLQKTDILSRIANETRPLLRDCR